MVEHGAFNSRVVGSSPSPLSKLVFKMGGLVFQIRKKNRVQEIEVSSVASIVLGEIAQLDRAAGF